MVLSAFRVSTVEIMLFRTVPGLIVEHPLAWVSATVVSHAIPWCAFFLVWRQSQFDKRLIEEYLRPIFDHTQPHAIQDAVEAGVRAVKHGS